MPNISKRVEKLEKTVGISDGQCRCQPAKVFVLWPENREDADRRCEVCGGAGVVIRVVYE
jgi:hypothetical protein